MPRTSRGAKMKSNSGDDGECDLQSRIQRREESLKKMLNPLESRIMSLQSVLVWEKPYHTAALFIAVNFLFWLATTFRIYNLIGLTGATVVFLDMWANCIWPEIKVPPSPSEDSEDWTPVHPRLMSVPEICHYLARAWVYSVQALDSAIQLRKDRPGKFFIFSILGCCCLAIVGCYISGIYLLYFSVMGALLLPCAIYHNVAHIAYTAIEPMVTNVETKMNIRRTKRKKKKSKKGKHKRGETPHPEIPSIEISDSDEDMNEFVPAPNPKVAATLAKAAREKLNVDDDEHTGLTPGYLTPQMPSVSASRDPSDDESNNESSMGVAEMPSFDALDSTSLSTLEEKLVHCLQEDSELDTTVTESLGAEQYAVSDDSNGAEQQEDQESDHMDNEQPQAEPIQFVSEYFKQSDNDDNDEESLAQGLDFPDVEDVLAKEAKDEPSYLAQSQLLSDAASKTSQVVSQTVSSIMSGTMSGLNMLSQTVTKATKGNTAADNSGTGETGSQPASQEPGETADDQESKVAADRTETETIEEEFEFLNEDDFDSMN